jgi:serine/threonine protein phosphatase PrpC
VYDNLLFRHGKLKQITKDHSLVQDQIDQGLMTEGEARNHPHRNIILRAVGIDEALAVDVVSGEARPGDCFLLCSDGLTHMVDDPAIEDVLSRVLDISNRWRISSIWPGRREGMTTSRPFYAK